MPFKLIKLSPTGEIITGDALKKILQDENFHLPEMPPKIVITVPQPKREDYDSPGAHIMACAEWSRLYARPQHVRMELRDTICRQFARELEDKFHMARFSTRKVKMVIPGVDGAPKHLVFALRLTGCNQDWNIGDPIDWISYNGVF